jgi:hypothetical protein
VIPEDNNTANAAITILGRWVENELQAEGSNLMRVAVLVHYSKSGRSTSALGH